MLELNVWLTRSTSTLSKYSVSGSVYSWGPLEKSLGLTVSRDWNPPPPCHSLYSSLPSLSTHWSPPLWPKDSSILTCSCMHSYKSISFSLCSHFLFFKIFIYLFIYLFLAALGFHCCSQAFSSCSEWGLLFVAVCGLPIVVASLVAEHGL